MCAACIELLQIPALFVVHLRTLSVFYMIDLNCYLSQHALLFKNTTVLPESFDNVNAKLLVVVAAAATVGCSLQQCSIFTRNLHCRTELYLAAAVKVYKRVDR